MTTPPAAAGDEWAGERVARWLQQAAGLEAQLAPVSEVLFAAARPGPGEAVLDVGCGTGPTTRAAAALVQPGGRVSGLDVSADMLDAAAEAAAADRGGAPIDWIRADAATWAGPTAAYDLVISRFGVMFFDDPGAAAAVLARATRPGGRLAVAVWGPRPASPLFELPYRVTLDVLRERGLAAEELPVDGGPFSWHDAERVTALLGAAGWSDVRVDVHRLPLPFVGGVAPRAAAQEAFGFGPTRLLTDGIEPATADAVRAALERAFAGHCDAGGGVVLDAEVRIVTARR